LTTSSRSSLVATLLVGVLAACSGGASHGATAGTRPQSGGTSETTGSTSATQSSPTKARATTGLFPCPVSPVIANGRADDQRAISQAALEWVHREKRWPDGRVTAVNRVGDTTASPYAGLFAYQVPRCGARVAKASWVVELTSDSQSHIGASVSQSQTVVAHFADGWRVWAVYH
jgi:hypothetical protein